MLSPNHFHQKIRYSHKFLASKTSSSTQVFFNCCNKVDVEGLLVNQIKHSIYQPKISIKQLKKSRQYSFFQLQSQSRSKSKKTKTSIKTFIQNIRKKNLKENQKISKTSIQLPKNVHKEKIQSKIQFQQIKTQEKLAVNNFNTTNYLVEQCLVQPQETNLFFQENDQNNTGIQDQLNNIFDSKNQNSYKAEVRIQNKNKIKTQKPFKQKDFLQLRPYANFSFGQRQKQQFFRIYLNKIVLNRKQSNNQIFQNQKTLPKQIFQMYYIDSSIQRQLNKLNEEQKNKLLNETFSKKSLNLLVNKDGRTIVRSQSGHTQSKESMVIETHKSIIQKYRNQKEFHLVS